MPCSRGLSGLATRARSTTREGVPPRSCVPPHGSLSRAFPPFHRWYRRTGLVVWPRAKRLVVTAAAELPFQVLRLHTMLVSPFSTASSWQHAAWQASERPARFGCGASALPCALLQNPAGAQPPAMPVWEDQAEPALTAVRELECLSREYDPSAARPNDVVVEEEWALGMRSDDEEWGSLVRSTRKQVSRR